MDKTQTLRLPSDPDEIERLPGFVRQLTKLAGCDDEKEHDIMLAITEAVTNAVFHGNKQDPSKNVDITARLTSGQIKVTIQDQGDGFDPKSIPDPRKQENLMKPGGRGVLLMKQYADEVRFNQPGNCVELVFRL